MPRHSTRRAEGRPSGSTVASVIACAFLISAKASCCQLARSGSGSSGRGSGSAGLVTLFLQERERAGGRGDRKSTRLNSSHGYISYAVFCLKKKKRPALFPNPGQR